MFQIEAASLLQIKASVVTNWGSYYKLGQPLLQNRAAITNWGKMYYKLEQVLQIRAIITNWGITRCSAKKVFLEISQNSQENTCDRVSFLIKLKARPATLLKRDSGTGVFL